MDRYYGARPTNQDLPELTTDWVSDSVWFQKQGRGKLLLNSVAEKQTTLRQLPFPEWLRPVVTQEKVSTVSTGQFLYIG